LLAQWSLPADWAVQVNQPQTEAELEAVQRALQRGQPFGSASWQGQAAKRLNLEYTFRNPGRPKKRKQGA
jgi:hypothetical protein